MQTMELALLVRLPFGGHQRHPLGHRSVMATAAAPWDGEMTRALATPKLKRLQKRQSGPWAEVAHSLSHRVAAHSLSHRREPGCPKDHGVCVYRCRFQDGVRRILNLSAAPLRERKCGEGCSDRSRGQDGVSRILKLSAASAPTLAGSRGSLSQREPRLPPPRPPTPDLSSDRRASVDSRTAGGQ